MKYTITLKVDTLADNMTESEARIDDLLDSIDYDKFDLQFLSDDFSETQEETL